MMPRMRGDTSLQLWNKLESPANIRPVDRNKYATKTAVGSGYQLDCDRVRRRCYGSADR